MIELYAFDNAFTRMVHRDCCALEHNIHLLTGEQVTERLHRVQEKENTLDDVSKTIACVLMVAGLSILENQRATPAPPDYAKAGAIIAGVTIMAYFLDSRARALKNTRSVLEGALRESKKEPNLRPRKSLVLNVGAHAA